MNKIEKLPSVKNITVMINQQKETEFGQKRFILQRLDSDQNP